MSVVTGITLHTSCVEDRSQYPDAPLPIVQINQWLADRSFGHLVSVENSYGGNKHPQVLVYGGGFNHFPEDEFAEFVMALPWRNPENLVLLINPEDGPTKIYTGGDGGGQTHC